MRKDLWVQALINALMVIVPLLVVLFGFGATVLSDIAVLQTDVRHLSCTISDAKIPSINTRVALNESAISQLKSICN
jgi:hypothetical protein